MTSDCLPQSGTRSIASKAFESSSSPKRSSRRMPTMPALNTAPTRRPSRRTRRATAPNTAPLLPLLLPRAPRPTAPSRAARTSWSAPRFSSCLEVRAHHDAPAARHASAQYDARSSSFPTGAFVADFEAADLFFLHEWVRRANATVVYVTYEFAPQAPFPTGLEQVMTSDDL